MIDPADGSETPSENLHLLFFEKRLVARAQPIQLQRLEAESPSATPEKKNRAALARALIGCRALWGLIGIAFVALGLILQLTVGLWCLIGYAGVAGCICMNVWRIQQSKRLLTGNAG